MPFGAQIGVPVAQRWPDTPLSWVYRTDLRPTSLDPISSPQYGFSTQLPLFAVAKNQFLNQKKSQNTCLNTLLSSSEIVLTGRLLTSHKMFQPGKCRVAFENSTAYRRSRKPRTLNKINFSLWNSDPYTGSKTERSIRKKLLTLWTLIYLSASPWTSRVGRIDFASIDFRPTNTLKSLI